MANDIRRRSAPIHQFRAETKEDGKHYISGYAALFNVLSEELAPGIRERLAPGCFTEALTRSEVTCNINHDDQYLLGRTSSGTLKLRQDELGLWFEVEVPDTSYARDLAVLMGPDRLDVSKNSFAFTVDPADIDVERVSQTESVETVKRVRELFDVAVVTSRPAYNQTFSAFRALENDPQTPESRTAEGGDKGQKPESRTADGFEIALALAKLDLQLKSIEV